MYYEDCTVEEIMAYKALENEYFNFGEGPMRPSDGEENEDFYYNLRLSQENAYKNKQRKQKKQIRVSKSNSYWRNIYEKKKLNKLYSKANEKIHNKDLYKKRQYYEKAKYHKKASNKKVRQTTDIPNGNQYKKVYEYWWNMF